MRKCAPSVNYVLSKIALAANILLCLTYATISGKMANVYLCVMVHPQDANICRA